MADAAPARPRVTVAIVSWNTRELLSRCLASLRQDVDARRAGVWVVDNGSDDGSAEAVRNGAPWAHLLQPGRNLGFGAAVNLVAAQSDSEWLACANADVALTSGALERLLLRAQERSDIGCVAPRLVLPDGRTQQSVHPFPTVPFALAFQFGLHRLNPSLGARFCLEGFWDPQVGRDVPWAIGAFLLLRRAAFDSVGGFDERQWLYAEDLDLGWRLHDRGWATRYEPHAIVQHEAGAATGAAFGARQTFVWQRATYAVIRRRNGIVAAWIIGLLNVLGSTVRMVVIAPVAPGSHRFRAALAVQRMWLRAHLEGLRGLLPGRTPC